MIEAIREGENKLNFTGNWFIDAGIIGFVNLMEEVYGWKQNDVTMKSLKEKERFYYAYFAYYIKKTAFEKYVIRFPGNPMSSHCLHNIYHHQSS